VLAEYQGQEFMLARLLFSRVHRARSAESGAESDSPRLAERTLLAAQPIYLFPDGPCGILALLYSWDSIRLTARKR
jgi:hypothetical protein